MQTRNGFFGNLSGKSIDDRLNLQARTAMICSVAIIGTILAGSLAGLDRQAKSATHGRQAIAAAMLEKDFTSLERDVFRHAAVLTPETLAGVEANVGDLEKSIAAAREVFDDQEDVLLEKVSATNVAYVQAVRRAFAGGGLDRTALAEAESAGEKADEAIEAIREPVLVKHDAANAEQTTLAWLTFVALTIVALIAGTFSFLLAQRIRRSISGELGSLGTTLGRITAGEYDVVVPFTERTDEIGKLAAAAVHLRDTSAARENADAEMRSLVDGMIGALDGLARGDLTVSMPEAGSTFAKLRDDFNGAVRTLHDAFRAVAGSAEAIACGASEIDTASSDLARRTESHASELGEASTSLSVVTGTVKETAASASEAAGVVGAAVQEATQGEATIRNAVSAMSNIEKASHEINQIVGVIDGITFQTNLLALNAGVEAARAGDAGKGFAVVASEVRALAQRSSDAASQIRTLIEASSREVSGGVELVRRAGDTFEAIGQRIGQITALVDRIREGAQAQSSNLVSINTAVAGMDKVTQQNAAMVEESSAAARSLAGEAQELTHLVNRFRVERAAGGHSGQMATPAPVRSRQDPAPVAFPAPVRREPAPAPRDRKAALPVMDGNLALAVDDGFSEF